MSRNKISSQYIEEKFQILIINYLQSFGIFKCKGGGVASYEERDYLNKMIPNEKLIQKIFET